MPLVVQIMPTREGRAPWEPENQTLTVELEAYGALIELVDNLADGGIVHGQLLYHRAGAQRGQRIVTARKPIALTTAAVARIAVTEWSLIEAEAAA